MKKIIPFLMTLSLFLNTVAPAMAGAPEEWKVVEKTSLQAKEDGKLVLKARRLRNADGKEKIEIDRCDSEGVCALKHSIPAEDFQRIVDKGELSTGRMAVFGVIALFTMGVGGMAIMGGEAASDAGVFLPSQTSAKIRRLHFALKEGGDYALWKWEAEKWGELIDEGIKRYVDRPDAVAQEQDPSVDSSSRQEKRAPAGADASSDSASPKNQSAE